MGKIIRQKAAGELLGLASSRYVIISDAATGSSRVLQRPGTISVKLSGTLVVVDGECRAALRVNPLLESVVLSLRLS